MGGYRTQLAIVSSISDFRKIELLPSSSNIISEAPSHDAEGCLCCGGLIETHIHLDKSRIVDRCAPEPSRSQPDQCAACRR